MAPFAAIFIALSWSTVGLLIAWSRGYTLGGMILTLGGIIGGGVGVAVLGAYALTGWDVIIQNQRDSAIACAGVLIGAMCGLYAAERIRDHQFPTPRQLMTAIFGFFIGLLCAYILLFFTYNTWARGLGAYVLIPATIGTATLAGSAFSQPLPD